MNWERIQKWDYVVASVSAEYHKKFHMVELDDIRQSLYQWFVEHPNKLNEWEAIGEKDAKNLIYRSLRNQALDYCQKWKAKASGYDVDDLHYYSAGTVEFVLPYVLRGEFSKSHKIDLGLPHAPTAPAEGGNFITMLIEIDYAYWKLSKEERKFLFLRYHENMEYEDIAIEMNSGKPDATRMRINRIIKKLISKLGGFTPYFDADSEPKENTDSPTLGDESD